jgi:hypothetical protein
MKRIIAKSGGNMVGVIGTVRQVVGEVFAVASDGTRRLVVEGDQLYAGEQLQTGAGGAVAVNCSLITPLTSPLQRN